MATQPGKKKSISQGSGKTSSVKSLPLYLYWPVTRLRVHYSGAMDSGQRCVWEGERDGQDEGDEEEKEKQKESAYPVARVLVIRGCDNTVEAPLSVGAAEHQDGVADEVFQVGVAVVYIFARPDGCF